MSSKKISPEFSKFLLDLKEILNRVELEADKADLPNSEKELFRKKLLDEYLNQFLEINFLKGEVWFFRGKEELLRKLKSEIAVFFQTSPDNVHIVGSARKGFSLKRGGKAFNDSKTNEKGVTRSDIDVAIIDDERFSYYRKKVREIKSDFEDKSRPFFSDEVETLNDSVSYIIKGWIRPDILFGKEKNEWNDFFDSISHAKDIPFKIRGGLYSDSEDLLSYLSKGVNKSLDYFKKLIKDLDDSDILNDTNAREQELLLTAFLYLLCPFSQKNKEIITKLTELIDVTEDEFSKLKDDFISKGLLKFIGDEIYFEKDETGKEAVNYLLKEEAINPSKILELSNILEQ